MSSKNLINLGISPDSGTGDSARRGGEKINALFAELYANLGDNPVITDITDINYGTRQVFAETEFKVGEIHSAGKYSIVEFGAPTAGSTSPSATGFTSASIQTDSDWFFLSRGDSIGAIVKNTNVFNVVLPLAVAGDVIRIKDVAGTFSNKTMRVWTTPYENTLNTANWASKTIGNVSKTAPDSDCVAVSIIQRSRAFLRKSSPYKSTNFTLPWVNDPLAIGFSTLQGRSEVEFTYNGPHYGWQVTHRVGPDEFQHAVSEIDSDLEIAAKGRSNRNKENITGTAATPIDYWPIFSPGNGGYRTAKYLIQAVSTTDHIQSSELLVTYTTTHGVRFTEYGIVKTSTSDLVNFTVDTAVDPTNGLLSVRLSATAAVGHVIKVSVHRTNIVEE
jgi:hypothetical protein